LITTMPDRVPNLKAIMMKEVQSWVLVRKWICQGESEPTPPGLYINYQLNLESYLE
jgi:hypothetical protein